MSRLDRLLRPRHIAVLGAAVSGLWQLITRKSSCWSKPPRGRVRKHVSVGSRPLRSTGASASASHQRR